MKLLFLIAILLVQTNINAQDLLKERIRKIGGTKTSIYIERGVFHNGGVKQESTIKSIRQSYNPKQGFERIVIDFSSASVPKVYGHISSEQKMVYVDIFDTSLAKDMQTIAKTTMVEKVNFFPLEENFLSVEFKLKSSASADIFYLENPGRLVIDLKK